MAEIEASEVFVLSCVLSFTNRVKSFALWYPGKESIHSSSPRYQWDPDQMKNLL